MSQTYMPRQEKQTKLPQLATVMQIARNREVPVPAPKPPVEHKIPLMSMGLMKPPPKTELHVLRISQAEVDELVSWAEGKFLDKWPNATTQHLAHFVRQSTGLNDYGAFRTLESWGVVQLVRSPFEPRPIAELMFLVTKKPVHGELMALIRQMIDWAKTLGCARFQVSEYVDFDLTPVLDKLEITEKHETRFLVL